MTPMGPVKVSTEWLDVLWANQILAKRTGITPPFTQLCCRAWCGCSCIHTIVQVQCARVG